MQLIFILEQVLNGLLIGVYYLLIALGLSLIFSLGGIVNLAHGAFYAIGAYLTVILSRHIGYPLEQIYTGNIAESAHSIAADNFINLKDAGDRGRIADGDRLMLFDFGFGASWACLLLEA